jgi:hypothetical protein
VLNKRSVIVLLIGLNLLLATVLMVGSYSLPAAFAQVGGQPRAGDFLCVTAKPAGQSYDVVYVLDSDKRKLHAFYPTSARSPKYSYGQFVDLAVDFGR